MQYRHGRSLRAKYFQHFSTISQTRLLASSVAVSFADHQAVILFAHVENCFIFLLFVMSFLTLMLGNDRNKFYEYFFFKQETLCEQNLFKYTEKYDNYTQNKLYLDYIIIIFKIKIFDYNFKIQYSKMTLKYN